MNRTIKGYHHMTFKFSTKKKPLAVETRLKSGRKIMIDGIKNQIKAIEDPEFSILRNRYHDHKNEDGTVTRKKSQVAVRPRKWWWMDDDGTYYLELRYGASTTFEPEPGKSSIVCGDTIEGVLLALRNAQHYVEKGFWDEQIANYKERSRRRPHCKE